MLINLSSNGENSPSKFNNHFTDNIVIKPNSTVSLVRASMVRSGSHLTFTIPAGTSISFRTSPYDIYTAEICNVDTRYTSTSLTARLNELLNGKIAWNYEIKAIVEHISEFDFEIRIVSFNNMDKWNGTNLNYFIWGDTTTFQSNIKQCRLFGGADGDLPISNKAGGELQGIRFIAQNCGAGAGWGDNITPITNQIQSRTFNHFTASAFAQSKFNISSGFTGDNGIRLTLSYATTLEPPDDDRYATGGGIPGMIGWGNSHPLMLKIGPSGTAANSGKISLELYDHVAEQMDVINAGGTEYYMGDQIMFLLEGGQTVGANYDEGHLFAPVVKKFSNFGLVLWAGCRVTSSQFWNIFSADAVTNANFWDAYGDVSIVYNPEKAYGTRVIRGFKNSNAQQIEMDFKSDLNPVTTTPIQRYSAPNYFNESIFFRAYSIGAGVTDDADEGQYLLLDSNGINIRNIPTFISFTVIFADKSAHTTQTERGILGGTTHPQILRFDLAGGVNPDFTIIEHDGTSHNGNLQDSGAVRITWALDNPYLVQIVGFGAVSTDLDVIVTDLSTNTVFFNTITLAAGGLGALHTVGANNPSQPNNQHFLHGYLSDFRIYQKPQIQGSTNNMWNNLKVDMQTYYETGVWDDRTGGFYANKFISNIYNAGEFKYCNFGSETPNGGTCTPFLSYDGTPTQTDNNWYNLTNIHFYPCIRQPNITRNQTLVEPAVYSDRGQGIVASNELNAFLDFTDYNETTERLITAENDNGLDTEDNPIFSGESELSEVDINDKIFNIEIKNLPHRTYNGTIGNFDKTIYQIGSLIEGKTIEGDRYIEHYPREKIRIPLENSGDIILNQLEVQISDEFGIQETDLKEQTNITIEIQ